MKVNLNTSVADSDGGPGAGSTHYIQVYIDGMSRLAFRGFVP